MKKDTYKFSQYESNELIEAFGNVNLALDAAIDNARERARLYVIPCQWQSFYNKKNGCITVIRIRK